MSGEAYGVHIPPGATCHVTDYSSHHGDIAACVPDEGLIILRGGRVVGCCDIGEGCVQRISILFTYQPYCKNYVLQLASSVLVVSHASSLKVSHTFEDVSRFEIGDFNHTGFPQLGLWRLGSNSMRVADLTASCSSSSASPNPVETVLSDKLRGLKVSIERIKKQLEEKKKLRQHCMFHVVGIDQCKSSPPLDKLVPLLGSSSSSIEVKKTVSKRPLLIKNSWQKLLDRKWILGCDVQNNTSGPLRALSLCVSGAAAGAVEWRVLVQQPRGAASTATAATAPRRPQLQPWSPWSALGGDAVLDAGQHAVIVATVPEPTFLGRSALVEVLGLVSAVLPDGRETWTGLPGWRLAVAEVLRGDHVPFGVRGHVADLHQDLHQDHEDVLASAACCPVPVQLRLEGRDGLAQRLVAILEDANLRAPDGDGPLRGAANDAVTLLVGSGPPEAPLHGALALLQVHASNACSLHLRVRDARHVFLLAHRLLAGLPQHTRLRAVAHRAHRAHRAHQDGDDGGDGAARTAALARALAEALDAELQAVAKAGPEHRLPRDALHALEVKTDLAAQALSLASKA